MAFGADEKRMTAVVLCTLLVGGLTFAVASGGEWAKASGRVKANTGDWYTLTMVYGLQHVHISYGPGASGTFKYDDAGDYFGGDWTGMADSVATFDKVQTAGMVVSSFLVIGGAFVLATAVLATSSKSGACVGLTKYLPVTLFFAAGFTTIPFAVWHGVAYKKGVKMFFHNWIKETEPEYSLGWCFWVFVFLVWLPAIVLCGCAIGIHNQAERKRRSAPSRLVEHVDDF